MGKYCRTLAVMLSMILITACLVSGCSALSFASVDETQSAALQPGDGLSIDSTLSGVTVTADANAQEVTAHLYGTYAGDGSQPELTVSRNGDAVEVRVDRQEPGISGWSVSLRLDVVVPAGFAGDFSCQSSAGAVIVASDMAVKSFLANSSAGAVTVKDIRSSGPAEVSSSAGAVQAGAIEASTADIHSSAGSVYVKSCAADTVRLQSSAGGVTADSVSGEVDASSSAGSVVIVLADVKGDVNATSSAGAVRLTLPADSNADIDATASAGGVTVANLQLSGEILNNNSVTGTLGSGGPKITVHSSAGSVEVIGK